MQAFKQQIEKRAAQLRALYLAMIALPLLGACGDSDGISNAPNLDASLKEIADDARLAIVDLSVPFERMAQAPAKLQAVNRVLQIGQPGIYMMRYSDDTLRQTLHVFIVRDSKRDYIRLTTSPGENISKEQFDIHRADYDEKAGSLILNTPAGVLRLTPQDVTPVGA